MLNDAAATLLPQQSSIQNDAAATMSPMDSINRVSLERDEVEQWGNDDGVDTRRSNETERKRIGNVT